MLSARSVLLFSSLLLIPSFSGVSSTRQYIIVVVRILGDSAVAYSFPHAADFTARPTTWRRDLRDDFTGIESVMPVFFSSDRLDTDCERVRQIFTHHVDPCHG